MWAPKTQRGGLRALAAPQLDEQVAVLVAGELQVAPGADESLDVLDDALLGERRGGGGAQFLEDRRSCRRHDSADAWLRRMTRRVVVTRPLPSPCSASSRSWGRRSSSAFGLGRVREPADDFLGQLHGLGEAAVLHEELDAHLVLLPLLDLGVLGDRLELLADAVGAGVVGELLEQPLGVGERGAPEPAVDVGLHLLVHALERRVAEGVEARGTPA